MECKIISPAKDWNWKTDKKIQRGKPYIVLENSPTAFMLLWCDFSLIKSTVVSSLLPEISEESMFKCKSKKYKRI